ncbi:MAG: hypothetical protein K2Y22_06800 [Candidatus Obscuribacterales bacterium]|nr:hypothetical protein [Candidatus Obscuribacterales bacterium]
MEQLITLGSWQILCDPDENREIYQQIAGSDADICTCAGCRRFSQIRDEVYPQEFRNILEQLGIDHKKEAEVVTFGEPGQIPMSGWFNFVGKACGGLNEVRKLANTFEIILEESFTMAQKEFGNKPLLTIEWHWFPRELIDKEKARLNKKVSIWSKLFGHKFSAVETLVLEAVGGLLTITWKEIYDYQLSRVNKIQRHANDKEVNLYCVEFGKVVPLPESDMLPNIKTEYPLASVSIVDSQTNVEIKAIVWVATRRIFSINFDKSPNSLSRNISVSKAKLLTDLSSGESSTDHLKDFVLPQDYLDLVRNGDTTINGWQVLAPINTRIVVQEEKNLCILAIRNESAYIGVHEGDQTGGLFLIDFETDEEAQLGNSLLLALTK